MSNDYMSYMQNIDCSSDDARDQLPVAVYLSEAKPRPQPYVHLSVQGDSRGIFCGDSIWGLKGDFAAVSSFPKPLFYRDSIWGLDGDLGFLKTLNPKHPKPFGEGFCGSPEVGP